MASPFNDFGSQIRSLVSSSADRTQKARQLAEKIRELGNYRWVGVYDVGEELVSIIAWSGPGPPAYPTFPTSKGLRVLQSSKNVQLWLVTSGTILAISRPLAARFQRSSFPFLAALTSELLAQST